MSDQPVSGPRTKTLSRRTFLRAAGVVGGATLGPAVLRRRALAQETPSPIRPDPAAKRGGTLRYAVHNAPAHFDVHQSGTVANIGPQSPMYDCLIRRDPRDGQTIIPDLAWKWDISPDGKMYTFYLRKGVKFHDQPSVQKTSDYSLHLQPINPRGERDISLTPCDSCSRHSHFVPTGWPSNGHRGDPAGSAAHRRQRHGRRRRARLAYRGWGTIRMYGFGAFQPPGYACLASASETAGTMMTSSPGFQFTGVATLCFAVS